jgi:hypothetical protein
MATLMAIERDRWRFLPDWMVARCHRLRHRRIFRRRDERRALPRLMLLMFLTDVRLKKPVSQEDGSGRFGRRDFFAGAVWSASSEAIQLQLIIVSGLMVVGVMSVPSRNNGILSVVTD